ncbi:MAG: sulfite exporter TauE/SafE family protein [Planctomycetes bacterium]|nr:sulfite exporter TauE/SafE family protein [Planctomycetota bacterium]
MDFLHEWIVPSVPVVAEGSAATVGAGAYIAVAVIAMLVTAISKGGFGGGVGMISVPLMLQVAPAPTVLALWLPVLIACDVATIRAYPKEWSWPAMRPLVPGMTLGILATTAFLGTLDKNAQGSAGATRDAWLKFGVGLVAFAFIALKYMPGKKAKPQSVSEPEASRDPAPWTPTYAVGVPVGLLSGLTTMIAHAAGPLVTMFLLPQRMDPRTFVGTTGRFYFFFNSFKVPCLIAIGWLNPGIFRYSLWLMALAPFGVSFGAWLNRRMSAAVFVGLIYLFLALAAAKLWWDAFRVLI